MRMNELSGTPQASPYIFFRRARIAALILLVAALTATPTVAQDRATTYIRQSSSATNGVFSYPWRTADAATRQLVTRLGRIDGKYPIDADTIVAVASLPFYDRIEMIYVKNTSWQPASLAIYFLVDRNRNLYRLTGISEPIHAVNAATPPVLNEHTVRDYLWFFSFFVRGEDGPFLIVENMTDTYVPKTSGVASTIDKHIHPIRLLQANADGSFELDAVVYYSNAVFSARFKILKSGMMEMLDDTPLAANLSAKVDAPLQ